MKSLRAKINDQDDIVGIMIQDHFSPIIITQLADAGYDFIVIDQEHGPSSLQDVQNLVIAAKSLDISILVRPPKLDYEYIAKTLDMGADGLMIPHIDTLEEAKSVIEFSKYAPIGKRGYGMRQELLKFGPFKDKEEYIQKANDNITIFIQVESAESADNIEDMISLKYIDGVIIGPADFTLDLSIVGQYENIKFEQLAENVLDVCKSNYKGFGIHLADVSLMKTWKDKGMNILMYSSVSGLIKDRAKEVVNSLKNSKGSKSSSSDDVY